MRYIYLDRQNRNTTRRESDIDQSSLGGGCILDLRVSEDVAPEAGSLMSIVDLNDGELLHELVVDLELVLLELRDYLLPQIDSDDLDKSL